MSLWVIIPVRLTVCYTKVTPEGRLNITMQLGISSALPSRALTSTKRTALRHHASVGGAGREAYAIDSRGKAGSI